MPDEVQAARSAVFDDYWTKPIDVRRFLGAVDALMQPAAA
jgi:DNA-binding response OmpR family regulator